VAAGLALWAPGALAAPPANDDFSNREVLSGSLPIEVMRTNDGATKESEEFLDLFAAAGHSVWSEWEATFSGWATIGACDSDFMHVAGVYTGTAVNSLTKAVSGNSSEGPGCPSSQRQYTFKAVSGTEYEIAVDGNAFGFPESPPPDTEGTFTLRIEQTPGPANDDFADALPIESRFEESFKGEDFYFGSVNGYNWNATTEAGEPAHAGGPNGASVWFSWMPPVTGTARIGGCCGLNWRLGMYSGSGFGNLQTVVSGLGFESGSFEGVVTAGTTYWLAAYGLQDGGGNPAVGSFAVQISLRSPTPPSVEVPPVVRGPDPPPTDVSPPKTTIRKRMIRSGKGMAGFRFASSQAGSSFRCKFDAGQFRSCRSPKTYSNLAPGKHVFKVVATDSAGNADPTPAVARFQINS
jgi:hypothetical protein